MYKIEIHKTNNENEIFKFIGEYMVQGKPFVYYQQGRLYKLYAIIILYFTEKGPKVNNKSKQRQRAIGNNKLILSELKSQTS